MNKEAVLAELTDLRKEVPGVTESATASVDGMLIASDTDQARPDVLAALAATTLGLGKSTGHEVGMGELREVVTRCAGGHIVVYAVGKKALLVVLGDEGLDVGRLHVRSRTTVAHLVDLLDQ
ncbi:roadblock/LC7 domain-containing protein [Actinocorallia sp. API 0066]|uniref:roadblock/LC7 domain-containing protein n=1 Tax=Actinocorallia sp. API 0066 TaxID=2896846 RepID=UPI001E59A188|nr:roadblock/LC7 domain-containing protein [Actinocorallia sp. API 0066]MCD0448911.1 roadblock/LC7 domain-containing protein [Actinocorallia sp. API 0066]